MKLKRAWLAVPAVLALSLGACAGGGGDTQSAAQSEVDKEDSAAAAADAGTAVITANSTEPQNPLIPGNTNEVGGGNVVDLLFAGLVYYDAQGEVHNDMAESIETEDSQTYTVTLKEGQTFSDGSPVTANSFVDAWKKVSKDNMLNVNFFNSIEGSDEEGSGDLTGLEVQDDTHFTIKLKQPESDFPLRLGYSAFYPLPESTLEDMEKGGDHPIGNGPYMFADEDAWEHNVQIRLVPSDTYQGARAAQNDGVTFILYDSPDPAYLDLLADNLDVLDAIPDSAIDTFQDELGDRAVNQDGAVSQTFTIPERLKNFEGEEGILRRQAISLAIDREEITSTIFNDTRAPARDFTSPVVSGFDANLPGSEILDFDPEKAKELWAEADALKPFEGTFEIAFNADGPHEAWVTAVTNQLSNNLGIDAQPKPYPDFKSLRDEVTNRTIESAFRTGWQADYPSAFNFLSPLYATGAGSNDGDYSNPAFDALLTEAASAPSVDEANTILGQAQEILFEDLPSIPLWYQNSIGGFSTHVDNVVFGWNTVPLYYQVTKN